MGRAKLAEVSLLSNYPIGVFVRFSRRLRAASVVLPILLLAACGSSAKSSSAGPSTAGTSAATGTAAATGGAASGSPAASGSGASASTTDVGIKVTGGFGVKPTLTIPSKAAPTTLVKQVLTEGTGATVAKGDTLVANYVGQTWAPKNGKPNVFDSSFDRGKAAAFVIGVGSVIPGWDKTLVGQKLGTRLVMALPPAEGYGSQGQSSAGISGTDTLVFVVDLLKTYKPDASAPGTVVSNLPASGLPKITNVPGKAPTILSTAGVKAPSKPVSTLLVKGSGDKIDAAKTLVVQVVETDIKTGKQTQSSWGRAPQTVAAQNVLTVANKLTGQNVGSRALVLVPATAATAATASQAARPPSPAQILIADVVGEF